MKYFIIFALTWSSIAAGCASKSIRSNTQLDLRLFPLGFYRHEVSLDIVSSAIDATPKSFSFSGMIRLQEDAIDIVVLSPFNTTLIKMHEDLILKLVTTQVFVEDLKKHESKFKDYYFVLKALLLAHRDEKGNGPQGFTSVDASNQIATYLFTNYDEHGIPDRIRVKHPRFNIEVKVSSYEI